MKILFIAPRLPHAGATGGHVIVHQRVKRLAARGHQVGLACFSHLEDAHHADTLRGLLAEFEQVPMPVMPSPLRQVGGLVFSSIPPYFADFYSQEMMRRVGDMVVRTGYDVAVAEFSAMGQYLYRNPYLPAVRKVISCHYSVATSYRKVMDLMTFSARGLRSRIGLRGLQRFEVDMCRNADRVLTLTAQERFALLNYEPRLRISVIPAGVDTDLFQPEPATPREEALLFSGHYENFANLDAALWFAQRTWPLVKRRHPNCRLYLVGPGAPQVLRDLSRRDASIVVTGEVPDIRPYLHKARAFVCPVRLGSGLRVKLLEALATGTPVVTTLMGAEGIPLQSGDNGFVADRPQMMSEYIDLLLTDEELRRSIGRNARALALERFAWGKGIDQLETVLRDVSAPR